MQENWQKEFIKVASKLKEDIDRQKFNLKEKLKLLNPLTIQAYRGFAGREELYVRGRVLENEGLDLPAPNASIWKNVRSLYHRFESDEVPYAPLEISIKDLHQSLNCNNEGFFELRIPKNEVPPFSENKWQKIDLRLLKKYHDDQEEVKTEGEVQVQQPQNSYGIISDVDDTIIVSNATEFLEKMKLFILRNSHTRKPLEGVSALYKALERGKEKNCQNPIFYVSSSSWNLYDVLDNFCRINDIPKGTFLLQELGLSKDNLFQKGHDHKLLKIKHVLNSFSNLPFVLIGDSGQKDPEIYQEIVTQFPNRIKAIYIRDLRPNISDKRDKEVQQIANDVKKYGVEMKLIQDSTEAAKHAIQLGLIPDDVLQEIAEETYEDKKRPSDIGRLLGLDHFL